MASAKEIFNFFEKEKKGKLNLSVVILFAIVIYLIIYLFVNTMKSEYYRNRRVRSRVLPIVRIPTRVRRL